MKMETPRTPHVLVLPFPVQGHIKPMLILAEVLSHSNFQITFVNTHHNQARLQRSTDLASFCNLYPKFRFVSIPDGLPSDHPRSGSSARDLFSSLRAVTKPEFRQLLINMSRGNGQSEPPTCVIADGIMSSVAIDHAEELGIPIIIFRTFSATCIWTYLHLPNLVEAGEVPFQGDLDMNEPVTCIPGLEHLLKRGDLPRICRLEANDPIFQFFVTETSAMTRASGLILNTFEGLESTMISRLGSLFDKIYAVGPLHCLLDTFTKESSTLTSSNGVLWKEDRSCLQWLDSQPSRSVIYVSFGSLVRLGSEQLLEFRHGLVNSSKRFLWVIRPDSLPEEKGVGEILGELAAETEGRGCIVSWAPQVDVLAHRAIGGFLTHSGWNSTLESISAGVPMICWPNFGDQTVNSRCVSDLWKIGFDMNTCDRSMVEKMVRDLIENKREEIMRSTDEISRMARASVEKGGSSYGNLAKLVEDIRSMSLGRTECSCNS